jgi:hypothetical protein
VEGLSGREFENPEEDEVGVSSYHLKPEVRKSDQEKKGSHLLSFSIDLSGAAVVGAVPFSFEAYYKSKLVTS